MGVIIDILDEYRTPRTVVLLERNKSDEWGGYSVKTKTKYASEEAARRAFHKALPPSTKSKPKKPKEKAHD